MSPQLTRRRNRQSKRQATRISKSEIRGGSRVSTSCCICSGRFLAHSGRAGRQQPAQLSGGKRTRLLWAVVSANDPKRRVRALFDFLVGAGEQRPRERDAHSDFLRICLKPASRCVI